MFSLMFRFEISFITCQILCCITVQDLQNYKQCTASIKFAGAPSLFKTCMFQETFRVRDPRRKQAYLHLFETVSSRNARQWFAIKHVRRFVFRITVTRRSRSTERRSCDKSFSTPTRASFGKRRPAVPRLAGVLSVDRADRVDYVICRQFSGRSYDRLPVGKPLGYCFRGCVLAFVVNLLGPPLRWIAPSTPPPPSKIELAALTIASVAFFGNIPDFNDQPAIEKFGVHSRKY